MIIETLETVGLQLHHMGLLTGWFMDCLREECWRSSVRFSKEICAQLHLGGGVEGNCGQGLDGFVCLASKGKQPIRLCGDLEYWEALKWHCLTSGGIMSSPQGNRIADPAPRHDL